MKVIIDFLNAFILLGNSIYALWVLITGRGADLDWLAVFMLVYISLGISSLIMRKYQN